jgi:hypothetical protein
MPKLNCYKPILLSELEKSPYYDPHWKASSPYPTWPFTLVNPYELAKRSEKQTQTFSDIDKALI